MAKLELVQKHIDTKVRISNRDLISFIEDDKTKSQIGIAPVAFGFIETVEEHIDSTLQSLYEIALSVWGDQIGKDFDYSWALNYRNSRSGRSNAGRRTSKWRSRYELKRKEAGDCININSIWARMNNPVFFEYAGIRYDPQIGDLPVSDWKQYVQVLMCHEFAHLLDWYGVKPETGFKVYRKANETKPFAQLHDSEWQHIYRKLRNETGNVLIVTNDPQEVSKFVHPDAPCCVHCHEAFFPKREGSRFCSSRCRTANCRQRKKNVLNDVKPATENFKGNHATHINTMHLSQC